MTADKELIDYIKKRCQVTAAFMESNKTHSDDRFKHIFHSGENSVFRELLDILGCDEEDL